MFKRPVSDQSAFPIEGTYQIGDLGPALRQHLPHQLGARKITTQASRRHGRPGYHPACEMENIGDAVTAGVQPLHQLSQRLKAKPGQYPALLAICAYRRWNGQRYDPFAISGLRRRADQQPAALGAIARVLSPRRNRCIAVVTAVQHRAVSINQHHVAKFGMAEVHALDHFAPQPLRVGRRLGA